LGCPSARIGIECACAGPPALSTHGFDSYQPTAWVAEGLLVYLTADAQVALRFLSEAERVEIADGHHGGETVRAIAAAISRAPSTKIAYKEARTLGPTLIVLEDLDLIVDTDASSHTSGYSSDSLRPSR
jgi:hypothetical protein